MSEALHREDTNTQDKLAPVIPMLRAKPSGESLVFAELSIEETVGLFITELRHPSRAGLYGQNLAEFIQTETSRPSSGDRESLGTRLAEIVDGGDAFNNEEIYDHKVEHDFVFKRIVEDLQALKKNATDIREQRRAALRLLELRAALTEDSTPDDSTWHELRDRLLWR